MKIMAFFYQMTIFGNVRIQTAISPKPSEIFCSNFQEFSDLLFSFNCHKNEFRNHTQFKHCTFQIRPIEGISANVNKLSLCDKPRERPRDTTLKAKPPKQTAIISFSCGYQGHKSKDPNCPAKGQICRKCSNLGHFEARCKSKIYVDPKAQKGQKWGPPGKNVRQISQLQAEGDQDDYAFIISNVTHGDNAITLDVTVGGVQIPMIVDSGATVNVVGRNQWEHLKSMGIKCQSSCDAITNLYAYGSSEPLTVAGNFTADVAICGNTLGDVQFNVIEGNGQSVLGRDTAQRLDVLKVGPQLTHINTVE